MFAADQIVETYHRATSRHRDRSGVSYPLIGARHIRWIGSDSGTIEDPHAGVAYALWNVDTLGRVRVKLT